MQADTQIQKAPPPVVNASSQELEAQAEFRDDPMDCIEKLASDFVFQDDKNHHLLDDMSKAARTEFQNIIYATQNAWRQEALAECLADSGNNATNVFDAYMAMWVARRCES